MKRRKQDYCRALLKIKNINKPIDLVLPQYEADSWTEMSTLKKSFIRFKTSPISIIEVNTEFLENLEINSKTISPSEWNNQATLFIKHLNENYIPIPKDTFNYEFNYPISFILFRKMNKVFSVDMSNYINLEYLISKDIGIESYLLNKKHWEIMGEKSSKFILAEYSDITWKKNNSN